MSPAATSADVLKRDIPWETYMTAKLISGTDLQLLRRYDRRPESVQAALLDENGPAYMRVFLSLVQNISKEDTVEYVLAVIDELLSANPKRARLFHSQEFENEDVYQPFSMLLSKNNWFMEEKASKILTVAISSRPRGDTSKKTKHLQDVIQSVVNWLCAQLRHPSHPTRAIPTAVSCLAALLREPAIRSLFVQSDGVKLIAPLISPASSQQYIQLLYEATLCMWLLSYHDDAVETITNTRAIPRLVEVVKTTSKEKVVRVAILTLKNLVTRQNLAADMVEAGLDKAIYNLRQLAWSDEDLTQALDALETTLKDSIKQLSSFEKYKQEVLSGNLDWTPMHKDSSFWKENIHKFEENDYQILRILVTILDTSRDPKTLAVACHDLSSFIQNHPAGRGILQDLRVKDRVMKLMGHENPEVAREALLCVQKILLSAKYLSYIH